MRKELDLSSIMLECIGWMRAHGVKHELIQNENYDCVAIYNYESRVYSIVPKDFDEVTLINHKVDFDDKNVSYDVFVKEMETAIAYGKVAGKL